MDNLTNYLVAAALALPLAAYVWAAFRTPKTRVATLPDYYVAFRQVGGSPFANSSLAYAFQIATLFPFLYWGVQGQILPAIVNAVCWGLGIFLFRRYLPAILDRLDDGTTPRTLHGVLGGYYNSALTRQVAAWVTVIGMIGVALAEAYWGMQILKVLVPPDTPAYYAVVIGALMFVLVYVWQGGTWGSMKTDMLQLVFSYLGFTAVFVFAIISIVRSSGAMSAPMGIISLLMVIGGALAIGVRIRNRIAPVSDMSDEDQQAQRTSDNGVWHVLSRSLSVATLLAMAVLTIAFGWLLIRSWPNMGVGPLTDPGDPQWKGVIALALMASLFQFVDMSAWQRLQSLQGARQVVTKKARNGLLLFGLESPFSWLMCISLGVLLVTIMPDLATADEKAGPLAAFPRMLLESSGAINIGIAFLFMTAVMGVMLSTIDSALLASMYAFTADIRHCSFDKVDIANEDDARSSRLALLSSKRSAFWLIVAISVGVIALGWLLKTPDMLIGVMVGCYGAMLSMFPAVFFMIKKRPRLSGKAIGIGMALGIASSLTFTIWGLFDYERAWDAVFAGPGVAAVAAIGLHLMGIGRGTQQ